METWAMRETRRQTTLVNAARVLLTLADFRNDEGCMFNMEECEEQHDAALREVIAVLQSHGFTPQEEE